MKIDHPMKLENLAMAPFNTTLMGTLKGAADYYDLGIDAPMLYGGSGHAFLINIHKELCPSGPYCWNLGAMTPLLENLGLRMTDLGFFSVQSPPTEREAVEAEVRRALDAGIVCSLLNMENQLITGYDAEGFHAAQPWPKHDFPPARLSFGSWKELGQEIHINFYTIEKCPPADPKATILASLNYAVDLFARPEKHTSADYGIGPRAYDNWIAAVPKCGASHGNWWNATVWSECRRMASEYFGEIGRRHPAVARPAADLSAAYTAIADHLAAASNKEMDAGQKINLLESAKVRETEAIDKIAALTAQLRAL
ncbi:MAG: hypothetical protein M1457_05710 [bacterium]|nr:hypothetical protein [bacterium]